MLVVKYLSLIFFPTPQLFSKLIARIQKKITGRVDVIEEIQKSKINN
jgi:hypothetical protein